MRNLKSISVLVLIAFLLCTPFPSAAGTRKKKKIVYPEKSSHKRPNNIESVSDIYIFYI